MLEKQKEWCKEKTEKGKNWIKKNKFSVGFIAGCTVTTLSIFAITKLIEPKEIELQTGSNDDLDQPNFLIRVAGFDRIGRESYHSPWARFVNGLEDKERVDKGIMAAINKEHDCYF